MARGPEQVEGFAGLNGVRERGDQPALGQQPVGKAAARESHTVSRQGHLQSQDSGIELDRGGGNEVRYGGGRLPVAPSCAKADAVDEPVLAQLAEAPEAKLRAADRENPIPGQSLRAEARPGAGAEPDFRVALQLE